MGKSLLVVAMLMLAFAGTGGADVIRLTGTSPDSLIDSLSTCAAPVFRVATSSQQIHARVVRLALQDSVFVPFPNTAFQIDFVGVQPDTYAVRVWASIASRPDLKGCEVVKVYTLLGGRRPWRPKLTP
jgi:hypothetical protein